MENFYELIKNGLHYNKFTLDELLGVEYTCPLPDEESAIWAQTDYIIHVLSGKKSWRTIQGTIEVSAGDTVYVKKGAAFIRQFFDDDFCMLGFFVSDDFIRSTVTELQGKVPLNRATDQPDTNILMINETPVLAGYFQSMLTHFEQKNKPLNALLELKFKELLISIITSDNNQSLSSYFVELAGYELPSLSRIMEQNYCFNLSLEAYARLCHRSLSSFKRDFQSHYNTTPGKWLLAKRLDRAAILLHNESVNVSQVAYECGFEDTSHFSRTFKDKFGATPLNYRNQQADS